jgi:hypothetical protein
MSLVNKLKYCPDEQGWTNPNISRAINLEKIADEYAIEFAEWLFDVSRIGSTKELLQIFKKEKGL